MHADLAAIGKALSAPARSAMLGLLLDGQSHTAGELATVAGIRSSTASEHLRVLVDSGLVLLARDGRFKRYSIADATVAESLEALSRRPVDGDVSSLRLSREQRRVRAARTCYDHLAGQLGVAVFDGLVGTGRLHVDPLAISESGRADFTDLGIAVDDLERGRRPLVRRCTDWTERRDHLAGALGAALSSKALELGWVTRVRGSRALRVADTGRCGFAERLQIEVD